MLVGSSAFAFARFGTVLEFSRSLTEDGFSFFVELAPRCDFFAVDFNEVATDFGFSTKVFLIVGFAFVRRAESILLFELATVFLVGLAFVVPPMSFLLRLTSFFVAGFCFFAVVKVGS